MKKAAKKLLVFLILLVIVTPSTIFASDKIDPYSQSSILIDQDTGRVLYQKNPDSKRPLASLSKMMTFLIAIEAIENKEVNANDIIKIDKDMAKVKGSSYHLKEGEEVPLIELMKGLMIVSGNDASIMRGAGFPAPLFSNEGMPNAKTHLTGSNGVRARGCRAGGASGLCRRSYNVGNDKSRCECRRRGIVGRSRQQIGLD